MIALLPGDGIGPEIIKESKRILTKIGQKYDISFRFEEALIGGAAIDAVGTPLPNETINICKKSDAILFGAVGGPKWDNLEKELRPEHGILKLRKELGLFANLRPAKLLAPLKEYSPLKDADKLNIDFIIIRELVGGLYFGEPKETKVIGNRKIAIDTLAYTEDEIKRITEIAFKIAQPRKKKITLVDKSNVLETSKLWRKVVKDVSNKFPDISLEFMYVDNCAMQLITNPEQFDVILTENTFGDILSDEAGAIVGTIGIMPSASIGEQNPFLYEPIHGSAPDIAGTNRANPIASILSCAMMLEYTYERYDAARGIYDAVFGALEQGYRTFDLKGYRKSFMEVSTQQMGDIICSLI